MIRNVGKTIKVERLTIVDEIITKEKISEISIKPEAKSMEIVIDLVNNADQVTAKEIVVFEKSKYDLLFSSDSIFDEGKQEGSYREQDLWQVIDLIKSEKESSA